jgi:hypothetical protein
MSAKNVPSGMPVNKLMNVAVSEICRERNVIRQTSGSPESSSHNACLVPVRIKSIWQRKKDKWRTWIKG